MKKGRLYKIFALSGVLLLGSIAAMSVVSCGSETTSVVVVITGGKNGYVGSYVQLTATVYNYDGDETVTWSSSNTDVATVDQTGLVSFLSAGTVEITATVGNNSSSPCELKVIQGDAALELTSSPSRLSYYTGEKLSFDGIKVTGYTYINGYRANDSGIDLTNAGLTYSMEEGTELSNGTHTITISYGSFASTSFTVSVGETITEKKLYVSSNPTTTTYVVGDSSNQYFSSTGLVVQGLTYEDGTLTDTTTLSSNDYSLSINESQQLLTEGNMKIYVYADGYVSTSFNIMVYTQDTTVRDLISYLQSAENYEVEIFNNVGTTRDSYGFHYLRQYTESYYHEIEYQNTYNSTTSQIEFSEGTKKAEVAYADFEYEGTTGIASLEYTMGRLAFTSIVSESYSSWWDMAESLCNMLTLFDLDDIPYYTLNDSYLTVVVEQVVGDDDDGTLTLANYPLIEQFLTYVGWSTSLITMADRLTISFNSSGNLEMRVDFGAYGYTSMVIQNIGSTTDATIENKLLVNGMTSSEWNSISQPSNEVVNAVEPLFDNNYTVREYDGDDEDYAYLNENYAYFPSGQYGYFQKSGKVYYFEGTSQSNFYAEEVTDYDSDEQTFYEYVNSVDVTVYSGYRKHLSYASVGLKNLLGDGADDLGKLHLLARYDSFTYGDYVTYQSFDFDVLDETAIYFGYSGIGDATGYRFWLVTYYNDVDNLDGIYGYDIWILNYSTLSGMVKSLRDVGSTSVERIETAISNYTAA